MRPTFHWRTSRRTLELGRRTLVMAVLNVTPDSFSDGGRFRSPDEAVATALQMLEDGADILDIGGESTRPGAKTADGPALAGAVSADEECARVLPVIEAVRRERPQAILSIDTYKSKVARQAVAAGAEIVNDVSGFTWDAHMATTIASWRCAAVLMHVRGRPAEWRTLPHEPNIVDLVFNELRERAAAADAAGITRDRLVLDPGFGFGKNFDDNFPLLAHFSRFAELGFPLLAATSRKSFLGRAAGRRIAEHTRSEPRDLATDERLYPTIASTAIAVLQGAHIVRVHDIRAAIEAVAIADATLDALR